MLVGYCGQTTAKLVVVSLRSGAITTTLPGASIGAWTELGADNSGRSGEYVCAAAVITCSGLSAFTKYAGTVSCDGQTIEVSFHTLPAGNEPYRFAMWTCERHWDSWYIGGKPWQELRRRHDASGPPLLWCAAIDDVHYPQLTAPLSDTATGMATTGEPADTGLEWDYALAWCQWFGLLPDYASTREPDRLWAMRNIARWCQWGDNEVAPNHCRDAARICRTGPWAAALQCWTKMIAEACHPPNDFATESNPLYWGAVVGPVCFASPDVNSFMEPFDGSVQPPPCFGETQMQDLLAFMDRDSTFHVFMSPMGIARQNEVYANWDEEFYQFLTQGQEFVEGSRMLKGTTPWTADNATLSMSGGELVIAIDTGGSSGGATQTITGLQIGETYNVRAISSDPNSRLTIRDGNNGILINEAMGATTYTGTFVATTVDASVQGRVNSTTAGVDAKFSLISVTGPGAPYAPGIMANSKITSLVFLKGDTHTLRVTSYHANGTTGLGGANLSEGEIWEICPGTITASGSHIWGNNAAIGQGGLIRFEQGGDDVNNTQVNTGMVLAEVTPTRIIWSMIDLQRGAVPWRAYQNAGSNALTYPATQTA